MRRATFLATILVAATGLGCFVGVDVERVSNPQPAFDRARAEVERLKGRSGRPHELCVLTYDRGERELVRVTAPLWLVHKVADSDFDGDGHDEGDRAARIVKRHVRLQDLEKAGIGVLVEVEEDDGDQVLVWLR